MHAYVQKKDRFNIHRFVSYSVMLLKMKQLGSFRLHLFFYFDIITVINTKIYCAPSLKGFRMYDV